jgi:hypothetical protein
MVAGFCTYTLIRDPVSLKERLPLSFCQILSPVDPHNLSAKPLLIVKLTFLMQEIVSTALLNVDVGVPNRELFAFRHSESKSKSKLSYNRQSVGRPVCPGVRLQSGHVTNFCFLLEFFLRQLRVCYFVEPFLTRRWVCNLLLLFGLASAVPLGSESSGTQAIFYCPNFLDSPKMEVISPYLHPPGRGWLSYTPGHYSWRWFAFINNISETGLCLLPQETPT